MLSLAVFLLLYVGVPALVLAGPVTALVATRPLWRSTHRPPHRTMHLAMLVVLVGLGAALTLTMVELFGSAIALAVDHQDHDVPQAETHRAMAAAGSSLLVVAVLLVGAFALRRHRILHLVGLLAPMLQVGTWLLVAGASR